jgi:hypothetical protein
MLTRIALASIAMAAGMYGAPTAYAQPVHDSATVTVDGVDYPVCAEEDCSDQPGQIGVWTNSEGDRYLSLGEYSLYVNP